jgi:hypothetical protein
LTAGHRLAWLQCQHTPNSRLLKPTSLRGSLTAQKWLRPQCRCPPTPPSHTAAAGPAHTSTPPVRGRYVQSIHSQVVRVCCLRQMHPQASVVNQELGSLCHHQQAHLCVGVWKGHSSGIQTALHSFVSMLDSPAAHKQQQQQGPSAAGGFAWYAPTQQPQHGQQQSSSECSPRANACSALIG